MHGQRERGACQQIGEEQTRRLRHQIAVISNLSQFRKMNKKSRGVNEEEVAYDALTKSAGGGNLDRKRVHTQFRPDSQLVQP